VMAVQNLEAKVAQAAHQVDVDGQQVSTARKSLQAEAIQAYVHGGSNPLTSSGDVVTNASNSLLRAEYVDSLAADQNNTIDAFHVIALQEEAAKVNLQKQTVAAQQAVKQVSRDRQAVANTQAQLQATENRDTGQIAVLVAQQRAAEERAAQAAAAAAAQARAAAAQAAAEQAAQQADAQRAAAAAQAAQAAASSGHAQEVAQETPATAAPSSRSGPAATSGPTQSYSPPPVGGGAAGAVAAAESRVGDPYVWGAAGPSAFDCSGLVMWAYAQVGISLPHFSGAQYADTTHIPMSDLEPGDLVFPADPGQHVAMYVGGGDIVQAPYTGADVQVVPLSSWFVLASRVE
jgi:peptidoglycan DL-endopeptidase CwlO